MVLEDQPLHMICLSMSKSHQWNESELVAVFAAPLLMNRVSFCAFFPVVVMAEAVVVLSFYVFVMCFAAVVESVVAEVIVFLQQVLALVEAEEVVMAVE